MRIIAGDYRRRQLFSPPGMTTRPIPDRVKESLFSALGLRVQGATFLDCFAGSGAIGLEALSRGAASCMFVEKDRHSADTLDRNIDAMGETCRERSTVVRGDALGLSVIARCPRPLDLAFFDPPYPLIQTRLGWERLVRQCSAVVALLADNGFLMLRTPLPHMVTDDAVEESSADARHKARRFKKHEKPRKGKWEDDRTAGGLDKRGVKKGKGLVIGGEVVQPLSEQELEGLMEGGDGSVPGEEPLKRDQAVFADWKIPGARGPETHEYGTMAVHFYMRQKD
jgi:16S rRNA (guanine966-N2)-methyltransferase